MDKYHNMITRNELANQINYTGNICRTLAFDWKQDFKEGDIYEMGYYEVHLELAGEV